MGNKFDEIDKKTSGRQKVRRGVGGAKERRKERDSPGRTERKTERETKRDRQTDREREAERQRATERNRDREKQREGQTNNQEIDLKPPIIHKIDFFLGIDAFKHTPIARWRSQDNLLGR